ncbi:MAG TPA: peptidylprolyl isomerase [Methanospirillum sp.]|nr:peptidylprolyl isomerase [Methanospirillum sp.]
MPVKEGDFIRLSYTARGYGTVFDTTSKADAQEAGIFDENKKYEPIVVCAGKQQVLLGLDEAIIGKEAGFEETIEIPAEKAFGEREQERIRSYEKKIFKEKPTVGVRVSIPNVGEGMVVKMIGNRVLVDFNHPLAGQSLTYNYRIEEFVESAQEQVKGIIEIYTGIETEITIQDKAVLVDLPVGIYHYSKRWLTSSPYVTSAIFDLVDGIDEVKYIETYKMPEKKTETSTE